MNHGGVGMVGIGSSMGRVCGMGWEMYISHISYVRVVKGKVLEGYE